MIKIVNECSLTVQCLNPIIMRKPMFFSQPSGRDYGLGIENVSIFERNIWQKSINHSFILKNTLEYCEWLPDDVFQAKNDLETPLFGNKNNFSSYFTLNFYITVNEERSFEIIFW